VFSVAQAALVATQRCGKHISAAVNQQATIEKAVFSLGTAPRLYNEDFGQLRDRKAVEFRNWQLQQGIERVFGVGSWQNN
jgi:hypothetical protein